MNLLIASNLTLLEDANKNEKNCAIVVEVTCPFIKHFFLANTPRC
jgi:hypothetical protein